MRKISLFLAFLVLGAFVLALNNQAFAIAAWARKYKTDCSMCHWNRFKLNRFGQNFLMSGYRMSEDEETPASKLEKEPVNLSDYASITEKTRFWRDNFNNGANSTSTFDINALSLYSGGPLDKNLSYFFEFYFHDTTQPAAFSGNTGGRSKLADGYLEYHMGDAVNFTTFRIGQFIPRIMQFHGAGARLSIERVDFVNSVSLGNAGTASTGNLNRLRDRDYGIEISRTQGDWNFSLSLVNGMFGTSWPNRTDTNAAKDLNFAAYKYFGDKTTSLGFYYHRGRATVQNGTLIPGNSAPTTAYIDPWYRYGFFGNYEFPNGKTDLQGGWATANYTVNQTGTTRDGAGYFVQLDHMLNDNLAAFLSYSFFDRNSLVDNDTRPYGLVGLSYTFSKFANATLQYNVFADVSSYSASNRNNYAPQGRVRTDEIMLQVQFMY